MLSLKERLAVCRLSGVSLVPVQSTMYNYTDFEHFVNLSPRGCFFMLKSVSKKEITGISLSHAAVYGSELWGKYGHCGSQLHPTLRAAYSAGLNPTDWCHETTRQVLNKHIWYIEERAPVRAQRCGACGSAPYEASRVHEVDSHKIYFGATAKRNEGRQYIRYGILPLKGRVAVRDAF